jgi:hypothetical protein
MARQGSKRQNAIEIMSANSDKPMSAVLPLIAAANGITDAAARSYYKWIVENGMAPGVVDSTRTVKAAVAPVTKPDLLADALEVYHDDEGITPEQLLGEVAAELKEEDEAAIRAANLQKIKEAAERFQATE